MIPSALATSQLLFDEAGPVRSATSVTLRRARRAGWCCAPTVCRERQPDSEERVHGSAEVGAGDRRGQGFAKKQGVSRRTSALSHAPRASTTTFSKKVAGRAAKDILAEALPASSSGFNWPKTMYWTGQERPALHPADPLDRRAAGR